MPSMHSKVVAARENLLIKLLLSKDFSIDLSSSSSAAVSFVCAHFLVDKPRFVLNRISALRNPFSFFSNRVRLCPTLFFDHFLPVSPNEGERERERAGEPPTHLANQRRYQFGLFGFSSSISSIHYLQAFESKTRNWIAQLVLNFVNLSLLPC